MVAAKRQASAAAGNAFKKQKCDAVGEALKRATEYPKDVVQMLSCGLVNSLGVDKEDRHEFQQQIVSNVGELLSSVVTGLQKTIADAQTKVDSAATEKAARDEKLGAAGNELTSKTEAMDSAQKAAEESTSAVKTASAGVKEAEKAQKQGLVDLDKHQQQKNKFEGVLNDALTPLLTTDEVEEKTKKSSISSIVKVCSELALDPSMIAAIPHTLGLACASRGTFDNLVCDQIKDELSKRIKSIDDAIAEGAGARSEAATKVQDAKDVLEKAQSHEASCKAAFDASSGQYTTAKADHKAAEKSVKEFFPEMKKTSQQLESVKTELQNFTDSGMAAYKDLVDSSSAKPAPEAEVLFRFQGEHKTGEETAAITIIELKKIGSQAAKDKCVSWFFIRNGECKALKFQKMSEDKRKFEEGNLEWSATDTEATWTWSQGQSFAGDVLLLKRLDPAGAVQATVDACLQAWA